MAKIISFTGESGCGKTSLAKRLLSRGFAMVTSSTTRSPRSSDLPQEYEYLTAEQFSQFEEQNAFAWTASYAGNKYGTRYANLDRILQGDTPGIAILVPEVVPLLLQYTQHVIPFFVRTPAEEILRQRLAQRGDPAEDIERRLHRLGVWESTARQSDIPYIFINNNGTLDDAMDQISRYL